MFALLVLSFIHKGTQFCEQVVFTVRSQDAADAQFQQHATFPYRA